MCVEYFVWYRVSLEKETYSPLSKHISSTSDSNQDRKVVISVVYVTLRMPGDANLEEN